MTLRQLLDRSAVAAREHKALMDGTLLFNAAITFAALLAAWFYRLLEIEIGILAWMFFGYTVFQLVGSIATDSLKSRQGLAWWMAVSNVGAFLFLALAWRFAGGLKNPMYLLSMFAPVLVAGLLRRGIAFIVPVVSVTAAWFSALSQSPELQWTMERFGLRIPWLGDTSLAAGTADPLPGVEITPSSILLVLLLFALGQLSVAILSPLLGRRLLTLSHRLIASGSQGVLGTSVSHASILAEPSPAVIVYSDSGQIHLASRSFLNQMLTRAEEVAGKTVYDVIAFDDPAAVREMLRKGGTASLAYRIGPERRVAVVSFHLFHAEGDTFSLLRLSEVPLPEDEMKPERRDLDWSPRVISN